MTTENRYQYPPPAKTVKRGLSTIRVSLCAACGHYSAREVEPFVFKCYRCKATIEYRFTPKETAPNGSHTD